MAKPAAIGWQRTIDGGWVCEVWQSAYGHLANKATWLYYHGTKPPFELRWARPEGTHQIGFHDQRGKAANKPTLGKREANATPLEFRDELLSGWPSGMDNIHADHELDAKTTENVDETGNAVKTSNLSRARTATIDWPGLEDEAQ